MLSVGSCSDPDAPRRVEAASLTASQLVDAVLDENHGPLRGRMDRIAATVQFADGSEVKVFAQLPERLRTTGPRGALLLVSGRAHRLGDTAGTEVDADTAAWLRHLLELIDAASLGPLQRATGCHRDDDGAWLLTDASGSTCRLRLRPDTLLPQQLGDGESAVTFVDFLRTTKTWMAQRVRHPSLGECRLSFDLADLQWSPDMFAPPASAEPAKAPPTLVIPSGGNLGEPRSPTPIGGRAAAMQLVLLDDPGDWPGRAAAYAPIHAELERQNQKIAGFPMLFVDGDRKLLAAPFRQRPDGPPLVPPAGWTIRAEPDTELLVVYPPQGDYAQRCAAGAEALQAALATYGRKARGAIVAQPFLHLQDGAPPAEKLAAPVVRISVALLPAK